MDVGGVSRVPVRAKPRYTAGRVSEAIDGAVESGHRMARKKSTLIDGYSARFFRLYCGRLLESERCRAQGAIHDLLLSIHDIYRESTVDPATACA